jgi:hypothetical protein
VTGRRPAAVDLVLQIDRVPDRCRQHQILLRDLIRRVDHLVEKARILRKITASARTVYL